MRVLYPQALIPLLFLVCLSLAAQENTTVRVGVAVPRSRAGTVPGTEARDHLVKALNQHKTDKKLRLSIMAVALDAPPGREAIAEGREKKCQFVLYMRVEALERSSKSAQGSGSSSQTLDAYTALMERSE